MDIRIDARMIPPTATGQMKKIGVRNGKPYTYEPPDVAAARAKLTAHLAAYKPDQPLDGALMISVDWRHPADDHHLAGTYKVTRPDSDNAQKILQDVMTQLGFWHDDAQLAVTMTSKYYSSVPGLTIMISQLLEGRC